MREPARWERRTIATLTAVALAIGVALVAGTGPAPRPPEAARSNDPAAACQDLRAGAMVACLHGNDAPPQGVSLYERPTLQELEARSAFIVPTRACAAWPASSRRPANRPQVPNRRR